MIFGPGHVLAVLGVVRDRVVHVADAALVHQIDDQLEFVQALEVRHLRRVTGLDEHLEPGLHQFHAAAAEHRLFAEEIGLGLFLEGRHDHAGLAAADRRGVGERHVVSALGDVLMQGDQHRHAATARVGRAHRVAGRFRRDHPHIEVGARLNLPIVDVEAVREGERATLLDIRFDIGLVGGGDAAHRASASSRRRRLSPRRRPRPLSDRPSSPCPTMRRPCAGRR